jgi:hypothetical protein
LAAAFLFQSQRNWHARLPVAFEVLDCLLVLLGRSARAEGTQVSAPAGLWIFLSRVKAKLARA